MKILRSLRLVGALWVCSLGLLTLPAAAQVPESAAERLMRDSGLWEQVADLGPNLKQGFLQVANQSPPGVDAKVQDGLRRLAQATESAFSPVALRLIIRRELASRLEAKHLVALNAWHAAPLGKRITALEIAKSAERDAGDGRQKEGERLLAAASPRRRALLQDFQAASRNAEAAASSMLNLMIALQMGVTRAQGAPELPPLNVMRQRLEPQRLQMQTEMAPIALGLAAEMYAELSDAALQAYVDFQKTEAGKHMTEMVLQVLDIAVAESAEELGRLMAQQ